MPLAITRWFADASLRRRGENLQVGLTLSRNILDNLPQVQREEAKRIAQNVHEAARRKQLEATNWPAVSDRAELILLYLASLNSDERRVLQGLEAKSPIRSKAVADFVVSCAIELIALMAEAQNKRTKNDLLSLACQACLILGDLVAASDQTIPAPTEVQASGVDPKLRVLLVHGTWGRFFPRLRRALHMGGTWFEEPSRFCEALRQRFLIPLEFSVFLWSGSNSARKRDEAALKLSRVVEENILRNPADQHCIVSHSHGGNVALKAMHYLGKESSRVLLVTLATPFLLIFRNEFDVRFRWLPTVTYLAGAISICFLWWRVSYIDYAAIHDYWPMLDQTPGLIILLAMYLGLIWCLYRVGKSIFSTVYDRKYSPIHINKLQEITNYEVNRQQHILVVRGVSDEASLSLAIGSAIGALSRFFTALVLWVGKTWFQAAVILMIVGYTFQSAHDDLIKFAAGLGGWAVIFLFVILVFRIVAILARLVFGRDLLFLTEGYEINTSDAPDSHEHVRIVTVGPDVSQKGFRHKLYYNAYAVQGIAEWLLDKLKGSDFNAATRQRISEQVTDRID
jgi:hypothetical protein